MLKKQVGMVVFLGVFAVVSLTVNTARAWRVSTCCASACGGRSAAGLRSTTDGRATSGIRSIIPPGIPSRVGLVIAADRLSCFKKTPDIRGRRAGALGMFCTDRSKDRPF